MIFGDRARFFVFFSLRLPGMMLSAYRPMGTGKGYELEGTLRR